MNEKLQQEIIDWLEHQAKFADYATHAEMKMQMIFTDWMGDYDGKKSDQHLVCENCNTVEDAYNFVRDTEVLNVHREYGKSIKPWPPKKGERMNDNLKKEGR